MLDATGKKLVRLLRSEHPAELRCAAALVLGEVGVRDADVVEAVCEGLDDADAAFRLQATVAAGKLRIEPALPRLLERITVGGPEADAAAQAVARLGAKGTKALRDLMPKVAPGLRRRIAAALGASGSASAETAALDALLDNDPGVVDAAARSLIGEIPTLSEGHRQALADHLLQLLKSARKQGLPSASETAAVRLLAALGDPRAEPFIWECVGPGHPIELRAVALQAVGNLPEPPSKEKLKQLFACAAETDFRVAAPALMLLKALPVGDKAVPDWLTLLDAPDVAVRRLALEKVGDCDTAPVAAALLKQLQHRDRGLRDEAVNRLARLSQGRKALADALREAGSPDDAWLLARAQAPFVRDFPAAVREEIFDRACTYLEAGDRRADALLFLLREADVRELRDRLEERALALRKKKRYADALIYLRLLARDPACAAAVRFELAACGLKLSSHDLSAESRAADPCLQQFAGLVHHHEDELTSSMQKAKWLEPEELFYLGFHFAEKEREEKKFGGEVLRQLVKKSPRSKLAKDAKSKLRREGLE